MLVVEPLAFGKNTVKASANSGGNFGFQAIGVKAGRGSNNDADSICETFYENYEEIMKQIASMSKTNQLKLDAKFNKIEDDFAENLKIGLTFARMAHTDL